MGQHQHLAPRPQHHRVIFGTEQISLIQTLWDRTLLGPRDYLGAGGGKLGCPSGQAGVANPAARDTVQGSASALGRHPLPRPCFAAQEELEEESSGGWLIK